MNILDENTRHYFKEVLGELSIDEIARNRELTTRAEIVDNLFSMNPRRRRDLCNQSTTR
jgi:hypothetical protein